jgi:hypothetical protein
VFRQCIVDLAMSRQGLLLASTRIDVDVVPTAMSQQNASGRQQLARQIVALHKAISFIW